YLLFMAKISPSAVQTRVRLLFLVRVIVRDSHGGTTAPGYSARGRRGAGRMAEWPPDTLSQSLPLPCGRDPSPWQNGWPHAPPGRPAALPTRHDSPKRG